MSTRQLARIRLKRRHLRIRRKIAGTLDRPRLCVYRSLRHIYAQIVDDTTGRTLAAASTLQPDLRGALKQTGNVEAAKRVGREIALKAQALGIKNVRFDRGGRKYHGRVKALAEAAREAGLVF